MLSLEEALRRILDKSVLLPAESVALGQANGRTSREVLYSPIDLPPTDNSAMDGYAVRADDIASAGNAPVHLRVSARIPAGSQLESPLSPGNCARVFTGSLLPAGADAVIMQEDVHVEETRAVFREPVKPWENVRLRGEVVKRGEVILSDGMPIAPQTIALLGAVGIGAVSVTAQPVVGLIATGNELCESKAAISPGQIYESNRETLAALVVAAGGTPRIYPIVPDDLAAQRQALAIAFNECDAVVSTGGVSVGELDYIKEAFAGLGGELNLWRLALKPGKPFAWGMLNGKHLFGLPGNPVSAFVTFLLLVAPALRKMEGSEAVHRTLPGTVAEPFVNNADRRHFMLAVRHENGEVRLAGPQASHHLKTLARGNGLVDVPPKTTLPTGTPVQVYGW